VQVVGFNALGRGDASPLEVLIRPGYDKLDRFVNYGWKWTGAYGIIDTANMVQGICASSIGSN